MKRLVWYVLAGAGILGLALVTFNLFLGKIRSEDEAPIRVRNGSVEFVAQAINNEVFRWQSENGDADDDNPSYSHEPRGSNLEVDKQLWVKVVGAESCRNNVTVADGRSVIIGYSDGTEFFARRSRRRSGVSQRTKLRVWQKPLSNLVPNNAGDVLTYAATGHITRVKIGRLECSFSSTSIPEIEICSSEARCRP